METYLLQFQELAVKVQQDMPFVLAVLALLWGIQLINFLVGYRLNILGIYPRHLMGIPGIVCAPFLHGNFAHLFFNSIPLFVFMNLVLIFGRETFYVVTIAVIIGSGVLTWIFGRKAIHVGASSVIMGYLTFLLMTAYQAHTVINVVIAIVCVYYFGGLLLSVLPGEKGTSWEGHLAGFISGAVTAYFLPNLLLWVM